MLKFCFVVLVLVSSSSAFASSAVDLVYSDLKFEVPGEFSVIGDAGGNQNILIFRYSDQRGKRFLAFSDMTNDETIDYGCPSYVFFSKVFDLSDNSSCNDDNIEIMRDTFVEGRDVEAWSINDYEVVYSGSGKKSYAFIIGNYGKLLKIDSDFLGIEAFRSILADL